MPRSQVSGHRPRAPLRWRVIPSRVREQHWKEGKGGERLLNGKECAHAFDAMRHWRDPAEERLRTFRRRRRTLINDNPSSG